MQSVVILGCGYTGLRLAVRCLARGHAVSGSATRESSLRQIEACGARAVALNLDAAVASIDCDAAVVYYMIPPAPTGSRDSRLERLLERGLGRPHRFVYLSTTGVYGDRGGAMVDEDSVPAPRTERAVRRLAAETAVREWADARGISWCILRVPGIYGPGRLPLERLRREEPAIEPREAGPGNRIQVEDLVSACVAAGFSSRAAAALFNVTDGTQDSLTEYLQRVARICNLRPPPLVSRREAEARATASSWSFLGESRRVDSTRIRRELALTFAFEDLDAGIRASQ